MWRERLDRKAVSRRIDDSWQAQWRRTPAHARPSLEDHWVGRLERYNEWSLWVEDCRTRGDARDVHMLEVGPGRLTATHRAARVEIDVPTPPLDERVEPLREALDQVRDDRKALREALCDAMASWYTGLMPAPRTIRGRCSCPDSAPVCRHALAVLLAFGSRLDAEPELLVRLRGLELLDVSPGPLPVEKQALSGDLAAIFGIDLEVASDEQTRTVPAPVPPAQQREVRREHLRVLGLSSRMIDAWRRAGVLGPTDREDVYVRTPEANRRISRHLAR